MWYLSKHTSYRPLFLYFSTSSALNSSSARHAANSSSDPFIKTKLPLEALLGQPLALGLGGGLASWSQLLRQSERTSSVMCCEGR